MTPPYPFSAIVGLADLRLALLLTAVSPAIGGLLVRGEKGTAKSTAVRAVAALLPTVDTVRGCRFACDPAAPDAGCPDGPHEPGGPATSRRAALVELPVGATEDRVTGTLDLRRAMADGIKAYEPGLLAAAHRGVLYVDEVNLLPDHLVDLLLDAAAMGRAHVERDGVSVKHAARFLLVGTMNPEEGEPRPQLVDRFGLVVSVGAPTQAGPRAEVVRRRLAYEADPERFAAGWAGQDEALAERIVTARHRLPMVTLPDAELDRIARICLAYGVDGLRADIVVARAAVALAAWHGRDRVTADEVREAARLALPHRGRRDPLDPEGHDEQRLERALREAGGDEPPDPGDGDPPPDGGGPDGRDPDGHGPDDDGPDGAGTRGPAEAPRPPGPRPPGPDAGDRGDAPDGNTADGDGVDEGAVGETTGDRPSVDAGDRTNGRDGDAGADPPGGTAHRPAGPAYRPRTLVVRGRGRGGHAGRRSPAYGRTGRVVGARRPAGMPVRLHLPATLHAAALRAATARATGAAPTGAVRPGGLITMADLREPIQVAREANLVLFVVDASGSMAARRRMGTVKTAVLSLLRDAYQRRDRVGMITFRGRSADLVLPPTASHSVAVARLAELRTGGRTPIAAGLAAAARTLAAERRRDPARRPLLVLVTDGRATAGPDPRRLAAALAGTAAVVLDCEHGAVRLGLARRLAAVLGADCLPLDALDPRTTAGPGAPASVNGRAA
jgi:magnesium chelatase subunit D